jgi:hypothetical protein
MDEKTMRRKYFPVPFGVSSSSSSSSSCQAVARQLVAAGAWRGFTGMPHMAGAGAAGLNSASDSSVARSAAGRARSLAVSGEVVVYFVWIITDEIYRVL